MAMMEDSAMFANGLPGGMRDEPLRDPEDEATGTPDVGEASAADRFDAAVNELLAQARAKAAPPPGAGDAVTAAEPELDASHEPVDSPSLPPILPGAGRSRMLSSAAFGSLAFHAALFLLALRIAVPIPEAPQEEGGITVSVVSLGNGDVDALAAGEDAIETPVMVEAQPVPVETMKAVAAESPTAPTPPVERAETPLPDAARPVEQAQAPAATPEAALPPAPVAAASPLPPVLAVAPTEALAPAVAAPAPPVAAQPVETETLAAAVPVETRPPEPEALAAQPVTEEPLAATVAPSETITAIEREEAFDIAPPVPEPSPWEDEPLPPAQVAARKAAEPPPERPVVRKRSAGSGGASNADARKGVATASANRGASQAAAARAESSGDGAAAMATYSGKVGSKLRRAVAVERYYRGHGPLTASLIVRVTLNRSGGIAALSLARSSGNGAVDAIVLQRARSAGPFGPFPASYAGAQHSFSLPINLKLER